MPLSVGVACQIAAALAAAHDNHIVHRDLTPPKRIRRGQCVTP